MTKPIFLTVNLPFFPGFYDSYLSGAVDWAEESDIENRTTESDHETDEGSQPEALRLNAEELGDIYRDNTKYNLAYRSIASDYVGALDYKLGEALSMTVKDTRQRYNAETKTVAPEEYRRESARISFESMDSPREYNFTTDRVYANIPLLVMRLFLRQSKAEGYATLNEVIGERHTSRDGFRSFYSNRIADWLDKPLTDWDHNELGSLLVAGMKLNGLDTDEADFSSDLCECALGDEGAYSAWENAVDWPAVEAAKLEKRAEKLAEWIEEDSEAVARWAGEHAEEFAAIMAADESAFRGLDMPQIAYRCPVTLDMFAGVQS